MADTEVKSTGSELKMDDITTKRATVTERLQKREEERLADLSKRKEEKDSVSAKNESLEFFLSKFAGAKNEIDSLLDDTAGIEKAMITSHFDALQIKHQTLQKFVTDNIMYLPPYEISKAQEILGKMQLDITEKREELQPKKKFAFRAKKKAAEKATASEPKKEDKKMKEVIITECSFVDMSDQKLQKASSEIHGKDVSLARLSNCTVELKGSPGTLIMDNLTKCRVFCGPVAGSIFIDNCKDCVFILACQQLRIHSTTESQFYIHVTSKAIIEDCNHVDFAPYNWHYETMDADYEYSGLSKEANNWDDVDDFNWLASDQRSPNWNVLPEEKRVKDWSL